MFKIAFIVTTRIQHLVTQLSYCPAINITFGYVLGLRLLNVLAKKLKSERIANGALGLASTEVRFQIDMETHDPIDVKTKELL